MTFSLSVITILLVLAPFAGALLAPLIAANTGRTAGWILAAIPLASFVALCSMIGEVAAGRPILAVIDWVPALDLRLALRVDGLSLVFALTITGIGVVVIAYAARYLLDHPRRGLLLSLLFFFMGAMLGVVLANALPALFVFWELTSLASFLLIGFDRERVEARRAAFQALIVTGLGGLALLAGGLLLRNVGGSWNIDALLPLHDTLTADAVYPWILGCILVAAFTKSAQVPFHFWLPRAMEAPTPVSAYLHSATMVQAGVYLLARMSPLLGGTSAWMLWLTTIGGITLLWGALMALRQTDLKQLLAQTTIASLGLLVLLLGIGGEAAAMAVAAYFLAHALYKAALFLIAGLIEQETGTRDLIALGGLRDHMTISFIATGLAALSMIGLPPFLGWFAKEEMFAQIGDPPYGWIIAGVLVIGSAAMAALAAALVIRPFFGPAKSSATAPHEGPIDMWLGPALLGLASLSVVFAIGSVGDLLLAPMASAITGGKIESHLALTVDFTQPAPWLSLAVWAVAALAFLRLDLIRNALILLERRVSWTFAQGFDAVYFALVRFAGFVTRSLHHGLLELYTGIILVSLALVLLVPLAAMNAWPALPTLPVLTFTEWGILALGTAGTALVVFARSRLFAIIALGVQGLAVALIFLSFGAPDLALTQLMVEMLSVVILALVMTRLRLAVTDPRPLEDLTRDGLLAIVIGTAATLLLLRVLQAPFDPRIGDFYAANSAALAHGHNIVNVILVDFRGLDTLGEIAVVMGAGIGILTLIRRQKTNKPKRAPRKKAEAT